MLITKESDGAKLIGTSKVYKVENVIDYNYENFNSWNITLAAENIVGGPYFVIDTFINEAFSHWFFESAIWLPTFRLLLTEEPELKLLLRSRRNFKVLIAAYFGIGEDRIVYDLGDGATCYFPDPITALNDPTITPAYVALLRSFRPAFTKELPKSRRILVLPRQKKENFAGNERITDTSDIEAHLSEFVLHTDTVASFDDQLCTVSASKLILVSDGAAFHVNGFVARNSVIVVFGNITDVQAATYQKMRFINELIAENNAICKIPYECVGGTFHNATFRYENVRDIVEATI